jgi:hypothetical protein
MAVISEVKIANMALSHIGASSAIENLSENTAEAQATDLWYDFSRLQTLEAFDWSFARKRQALALHPEDAPDGIWTFRYQYPADCVAFRKIQNPLGPEADAVPFEIELSSDGLTKTILTDCEDAIGVYTMDLETTSLFSAFFVEALSFMLAHHIAYSVTGKRSLRQDMLNTFNEYILRAPAQNANEAVDRPERDAVHIRARD